MRLIAVFVYGAMVVAIFVVGLAWILILLAPFYAFIGVAVFFIFRNNTARSATGIPTNR